MSDQCLSKLHPALAGALNVLPDNCPIALLTRHSIREESENPLAGYNVPLTAEGVELARHWGHALGRCFSGLFSSPVGRCMDTARAMADGAGVSGSIVRIGQLTEPGGYVQDPAVAGRQLLKLGPMAFASKHLKGQVRGTLSPREGAARILEHIYKNQGEAGAVALHVTHDTILASFIYHLLGIDNLNEEQWPWMLEGTFIWFDDSYIHWIWRGESGSVEKSRYLDS